MDGQEGRIQVTRLNIEFDLATPALREQLRHNLYNMATLPQKIQIRLIVGFSLGSLITDFTSIA